MKQGENPLFFEGGVKEDPQVRYTQDNKPWVTLDVASTSRRFDKEANEWVDGTTTWIPVALFGNGAEAVGQQVRKGTVVMVFGNLVQRSWTTEQGERRSRLECRASSIGVKCRKTRDGAGAAPGADMGDPWGSTPSGNTGGGTGAAGFDSDEPPF
ncbi:single-stranded DNA-binding protein [Collinsella bouchesdurhonensis]|uniref:single-stranded DNA-binding protein n=1 Tax=Bacillati TaxID=1783272 RepID=UPI003F8C2971